MGSLGIDPVRVWVGGLGAEEECERDIAQRVPCVNVQR